MDSNTNFKIIIKHFNELGAWLASLYFPDAGLHCLLLGNCCKATNITMHAENKVLAPVMDGHLIVECTPPDSTMLLQYHHPFIVAFQTTLIFSYLALAS